MHKLSIVLITFNSEKYLQEVLASCQFADEVLIVDSGSTDRTVEIAKAGYAKVYDYPWMGFGKQKQKAVELAENDWVFVLDSDEVITEALQIEITEVLNSSSFDGFYVPRVNYFFGKPIKKCGLYPDYTIRLFDKTKGKFTEDEVHEKVVVQGKLGYLKRNMKHYAYETIDMFIRKQNRYSTLNAKPNIVKALLNPSWTFFKMYFVKLGFLEGWHGYMIAKLYSEYTFWKYIKRDNE